tara:strand:+ start:4822 stop:4956 length:135 start_codon:yes stop_codon:yes gene_type:complete
MNEDVSANLKNYRKRVQRIKDATNDGKCWWLYQMLTHQEARKEK